MTVQQNFFAFIRHEGNCEIKRIPVSRELQTELAQIFSSQLVQFMHGIDSEIDFNGDWKPDDNELLTLENVAESQLMIDAVNSNATSYSSLDLSNFSNEPIKAIFSGLTVNGTTEVYVQKFSSRQALSRNELPILKMQSGNTFVKSTDNMFTIDNKLVAIISDSTTKFKSFHNARTVFDLTQFYREATDDDLTEIAQHSSVEIENLGKFIDQADSQVRKMVHTIQQSGILDQHTPGEILEAASEFSDIRITLTDDDKIAFPEAKRELKEVLHFLLEDIYKGPLSGSDYMTNSKREL